jgi:hypothetical protein
MTKTIQQYSHQKQPVLVLAWKSLEAKFRLSGSPFGDFVLQHAPKMFNRNKLS